MNNHTLIKTTTKIVTPRHISPDTPTKMQIFFAAMNLFATKGFAAVSVRTIAKKVGITAASIYNHYASKEDILEEIIKYINDASLAYYAWLDATVARASSLDEVMDCLFVELENVNDITVYYGVAILESERFCNKRASIALNEVFLKGGIDFMAKTFTHCIDKGWAKQFDTKACAIFIMDNVLAGSIVRVQEDIGRDVIYDPGEMFASLKVFLRELIRA